MSAKEVEAYFCSWYFPAPGGKEGDHALVKIKYVDGSWGQLFRMHLVKYEGVSERSKQAVARVVLEHFTERAVGEGEVKELVEMRGTSLCRIEPGKLSQFRQGRLF